MLFSNWKGRSKTTNKEKKRRRSKHTDLAEQGWLAAQTLKNSLPHGFAAQLTESRTKRASLYSVIVDYVGSVMVHAYKWCSVFVYTVVYPV
jgi:hypothetical protein